MLKRPENPLHRHAIYLLQNTVWSILPLQGGESKSAKRPPAKFTWRRYTQRRAHLKDLEQWFTDHSVGGLGIICGAISQLTVIEFDDAAHYQRFSRQFPELLDTYTVLSANRKLPHLYYHTSFNTENTESAFGSIRSQGKYVVAAGTQIGDRQYELINSTAPQTLSAYQIDVIRNFLAGEQKTEKTKVHAKPVTIASLREEYKRNTQHQGRNNSLFQVALQASHSGIDKSQLRRVLAPIHTQTPSNHEHKYESQQQRLIEANRTINSAYNYKRRRSAITTEQLQEGPSLPNRIREIILDTHKTAISLRLLEALLSVSQAGEILTGSQVIAIGRRYHLSPRSVQRVLVGDLSKYKNKRLIPMNHPVGYGDKGEQKRGRPPKRYRVPSIERLCKIFAVGDLRSDPVPKQALHSEKAYRMALQHALIMARPGQYGLNWMSKRLNVSRRTIQRYHKALKVVGQPVIAYRDLVSQSDVEAMAHVRRRSDGITPGMWLQSADGRQKWPCVPGLARKLLSRGLHVRVCRRMSNHYHLADGANDVIWREEAVSEQLATPDSAASAAPGICLPLPGTVRRVELPDCDADGRVLRWNQPPLDADGYPRHARRRYKARLTWQNLDDVLPPPDIAADMAKEPQWWQHHYLMVPDYYGSGRSRRFPVMRGLALRLMKEHGSGYVYFVTHLEADVYRAIYDEGLRALEAGDLANGLRYLRELQIVS